MIGGLSAGGRRYNATVRTTASNISYATDMVDGVPWFPRQADDLERFTSRTLELGQELDSDHPGALDPVYRQRRKVIAEQAKSYCRGSSLPLVSYTPEEVEAWGIIYRRCQALYPTHACEEFNRLFPLMEINCGYSPNRIPQLADVAPFLLARTGVRVRPVMGQLSSRDFLNTLAFRTFFVTQYIRHPSQPLYTPEPDACHELLGHVPLFADPEFASFAQEIGLASLGAADEDIKKLAAIFWFTIEYGMCYQNTLQPDGQTLCEIKAYGAGILSSFGELEHCLSGKPEFRPFDPARIVVQDYPLTEYQPVYFVAESFRDAKEKVREFAKSLRRPFDVSYVSETDSIQVAV
ncbi:hypothetical protein IWQ60_008657 [Tieghemiomyces parasiticus]|uniref:phenylalanine 4-monooxygenase n=1 Tax=Tieghemiomyces parasiticus TaxID=78921 RepID=A0A9W7ZXP9_9FUNG|nr:hypothetical protein IWQ60_008657 [Tieghemiomyces parasiticus]